MTQAICDITTDEVNVDVVVEPQADTMVAVANRAGGMEQVFHDETLIGNGNSVDLGVNLDVIATKASVDEDKEDINTLFAQQGAQDNRLDVLEQGKIDKDQGIVNVGKVLTVGGDGIVVPKVPQGGGGSGIGVVAHDDSLFGAGTDEFPLGVKDKVTITIEDLE